MVGPVDVVGDIHGEIDALQDLLRHLGYGPDGRHPDGRHLVFVGDLVDRGPDSPAVVRLVRRLVESGAAQMVLGNHELNLLRDEHKEGNGWFYGNPSHRDCQRRKFLNSNPASDEECESFLSFFAGLPVALERDDLRVVHACWDRAAIAKLAEEERDPHTAFDAYEANIRQQLDNEGIEARAAAEEQTNSAWLNGTRCGTPHAGGSRQTRRPQADGQSIACRHLRHRA